MWSGRWAAVHPLQYGLPETRQACKKICMMVVHRYLAILFLYVYVSNTHCLSWVACYSAWYVGGDSVWHHNLGGFINQMPVLCSQT